MKAGTRGHLWPILCTLWFAASLHADARNQQTFVIRYKNGEHTVPVTVVLDFKKQTEHVINMSPRAATKTVTLYDFKQKTIAYKDLTNRECFLGRLTHETMREETDALAKIQNPVEVHPKILSLDPHKSSLTPTEIRNMAGQKTAVFCGKMNTWLVLPTHSLRKREAEEVEERTFHRHGYHTVRYSHFGRETRRRYRNPSRKTNTSKAPNWRFGNWENASENSAVPLEPPSFQQQFLHPPPLETVHNGNGGFLHPPQHPEINGQETLHFAPTFAPNWNSGELISSASQPKVQDENSLRFSVHPPVTETPNPQEANNRRDYGENNFLDLKDNEVISGASTNEKASTISKTEPDVHSTLHNPETMAPRHEVSQQNKRNFTFNLNGDQREAGSSDFNTNRRKLYQKASDDHAIFEDTDVSSNVLEIPQTTKKSENVDSLLPITQTNEDVHDVFEGFFNLRNPPSEHLYNSYFIPPDPNEGRGQDESLINSYSAFPQTGLNNDRHKKQEEGGISKISEVITSTDHPSLTTSAHSDYHGSPISPTHWSSFPNSKTLNNKPEESDYHPSTPRKFELNSRSRTIESPQSMPSKDENTLNKIVDGYFTTGNPSLSSTNERQSNLRSDISSANKFTVTAENLTSISLDRNLQETNKQQNNLFHSEIQEGSSSQQIRVQNALRNYKPDQIVIDIEKIPTQRPPDSTLGFQGQAYSPSSNIFPNSSRNGNVLNNQQTSGDTWRGRPIRITSNLNRKRPNLPSRDLSFASRLPLQHKRRNESNLFHHRVQNNINIRQLTYPIPQTSSHPVYDTHSIPYKLDSLPPGVSIHPRHPKAPFADAVHSNVLPSLPQGMAHKPLPRGMVPKPHPQGIAPKLLPHGMVLKPHRQRHHKQKECCRGKTKSCCRSCCRGRHCCSPAKRPKQVPTFAPVQQVVKPVHDQRNRCQKEKLCRTLYESTQQVMVCRNAKIDGC